MGKGGREKPDENRMEIGRKPMPGRNFGIPAMYNPPVAGYHGRR